MSVLRRLSIRTQLLALVLAVVLPAAGLVAYTIIDGLNEAREAAYGQVRTLAVKIASELDLVIRDNEALLARLAERPRTKALDSRDCDPIIGEFVFLHPEYTTLGLRDRQANAVCTFLRPPLGAERVREYPWFAEGLRSGKFAVGDAFLGPQTGRWVLVLTHPVRDASGGVSGLLLLTVDLMALQERVLRALPEDAIVAVVDREDKFLMRSIDPATWIGKHLPSPQIDVARGMRDGFFQATGVDGIRRLYAVTSVASSGWRIFAGLPEDQIFAAHWQRLTRSVGIGIAVLLLVLALAYRIGSAIARPIGDLARTASDAALGGDLARAPSKGAAEVDIVARELDRLVDERDRRRGERGALAAHYEQLVKLARDIVLLIDPSGTIVEANDAAIAAYGYGADELRGMHVRGLRAPEAQATTEQNWQASARPEGVLFETTHQRKDGSTFPVEISSRAIDVDGQPYRQSFVRDITDHKRAEALLEGQRRVLELVAQKAPLFGSLDALTRLIESQLPDMLCSILLLDADGVHVRHGAAPSLPEEFVRAVDGSPIGPRAGSCGTAAYRGEPVIVEDIEIDPLWEDYRHLAAPHGLRACWSTPILDAQRHVLGTFAMYFLQPGRPNAQHLRLIEIATQTAAIAISSKRGEDALRSERNLLRQITTSSPIGITVVNRNGQITLANPAAQNILGLAGDDVTRHTYDAPEWKITDNDGNPFPAERLPFGRVMATGKAVLDVEHAIEWPDGRRVLLSINAAPLLDGAGGVEGMVAVISDITERKRAEQDVRRLQEDLQRHAADLERRVAERTAQLEAAKIRAEAADRVKSAFLATMSHELRTPLNSIIGFTGILLQKLPGPLNAEQEKQLGIVRNASRHLLALINDVLDISKVEAGELHLARERFDLHALLARLGAAFAPEAARRGLAFSQDIGENALFVTGDPRRVEQVLNNLLSNALKFTPRGEIGLDCRREDDTVVIGVTDTGVGIKPENMDKLFRPFSQIETGLPGLSEGTGLGLAISQHLAQAMGGRIAAESTWGRGSRFSFVLPARGET